MEDEEVISEYKQTLSELVNNAKVTINVLSMLADENKKLAPQIANAIEEKIKTAIPSQKLPALYLIDSIIKNVKDSDYLKIFTKNIVSLFVCVFERGDEKIRSAMYKLRQTWLELFPNDVLLKLDLAINSIDPAWPITASRPTEVQQTVHLNPDFFNKAKEALKGLTNTSNVKVARPTETEKLGAAKKEDRFQVASQGNGVAPTAPCIAVLGSEAEVLLQKQAMAEQLLAKQQELLQIQQRRLEIELAKAHMQIELQAKQLAQQKQKQRLTNAPVPAPALAPAVTAQKDEFKSPKIPKIKKIKTPLKGEELAGGVKANVLGEKSTQSALAKGLPCNAVQPTKTRQKSENLNEVKASTPIKKSLGIPAEPPVQAKPVVKKRKSGDTQKIDPRLKKKMMLSKDAPSIANKQVKETSAQVAIGSLMEGKKLTEQGKGLLSSIKCKDQPKKIEKEATLSEDLKDLFGSEDKDFRMQHPPASRAPSSNTQWKILKSDSKTLPGTGFSHQKVLGSEKRLGAQNKFSPYGKHLGGMHGRKALLPTPNPIFGQDVAPAAGKSAVESYEKLREMKKELDIEAERLSSLSGDISKNVDYEAFEANVMKGNSLLKKAKWNGWRQSDRIKSRRQGEGFREGSSFGQRTLLPAPPRVVNFQKMSSRRPSPQQQQYPRRSPPHQQPRSPGQSNFNYGYEDYMEDDRSYHRFGHGDVHAGYDYDSRRFEEDGPPPGGEFGGGYQRRTNRHEPNSDGWFESGPREEDFNYPRVPVDSAASASRVFPPNLQEAFNNFDPPKSDLGAPSSSKNDRLDVHQLFSKLTEFGILKEEVPKLDDFDVKKMKLLYRSPIEELHAGTPCKTCGLRFPPTRGMDRTKGEEQAKARYLVHLDWHFQTNKKANSVPKAERCRENYPDLDVWFQYEVVSSTRAPVKDGRDAKGVEDDTIAAVKPKTAIDLVEEKLGAMKEKYKEELNMTPVCKDMSGDNELCFMCHEGFDFYWDDEREEWCLRDAYKLSDKWFHPNCFIDFKGHEFYTEEQYPTKSRPLTPSRETSSLERSLEEEAEKSAVSKEESVAVKEEPAEEKVALACDGATDDDNVKTEQCDDR